MTEPTTKTGKQLHYWLTTSEAARGLRHDLISRVEAEAAQQERDRLRAALKDVYCIRNPYQPGTPYEVVRVDRIEALLADPEDDR